MGVGVASGVFVGDGVRDGDGVGDGDAVELLGVDGIGVDVDGAGTGRVGVAVGCWPACGTVQPAKARAHSSPLPRLEKRSTRHLVDQGRVRMSSVTL